MLAWIKRCPLWRRYTTHQLKTWWKQRKIDWENDYLSTWDYPHRALIVSVLKSFSWMSLVEIGCGAGANLKKILQMIPNRQVGGIDINPDAIVLAEKTFKGGLFKVNDACDIMMSDKATDVVLSDMSLIYVGPWKIHAYLEEIKRIARKRVVLCEFFSKNWWDRLWLRLFSGHNAHNYLKLLEQHGFYDIGCYKMPQEVYPGEEYHKFRYIIVAKPPRKQSSLGNKLIKNKNMFKMFNWKYRHFRKKLQGVKRMMLDLEFKRFKTREIREDVRQEYDNLRSRLQILEERIKTQKDNPTMEEGDIKRLDDQKVLLERDISRLKDQMKALDLDIQGSKPTNEFPDGVAGIQQQLDGLQELKVMLKDYMQRV